MPAEKLELTVLMPCLNESRTLGACVDKAMAFLKAHRVRGEVLVADNGSTDGSREIAAAHGARVVPVARRGYGSALLGGIAAAKGEYVIMGDADLSYDFSALMPFVEKLRDGHDLVMGNRFQGGIKPGAMPFLHRYLGNPVLSAVANLFFRTPIGDFHCGLRGFRTGAIQNLGLRTTGMEFASEMVVRATLQGLRIAEVPTTLSPDGRDRAPHLRTWRDGWRHLRFLLLYSPDWLFLYPGIALTLLGALCGLLLLPGQRSVFDVHTLLYCGMLIILGVNALSIAVFAKIFAASTGLVPSKRLMRKVYGAYSLELGLVIGALLIAAGLGLTLYVVWLWKLSGFGNLNPQETLRYVIPSVTLLFVGVQVLLSSFFLSILHIPRVGDEQDNSN